MLPVADENKRNLADLTKAKSNEITTLERKLAALKDGATTEKELLTSALDGANHMRRVQVCVCE